MKKWAAEFKPARDNIKDDFRSGCPKTSTMDKQVDVIYDVILDGLRFTVLQKLKSIDIHSGLVQAVLTEILGIVVCQMQLKNVDTIG